MRYLVILLAVFFAFGGDLFGAENTVCKKDLYRAAAGFARAEFGNLFKDTVVGEFNDLMCAKDSDAESMANIVILVAVQANSPQRENPFEFKYGIFHIHFDYLGKVMSAASFLDGVVWRSFESSNEWKNEWCAIVNSAYPDEREKFLCQEKVRP